MDNPRRTELLIGLTAGSSASRGLAIRLQRAPRSKNQLTLATFSLEDFPVHKQSFSLLLYCLGFLFSASSWAIDPEQLLPPDEAFEFKVELKSADKLLLTWNIADGYYLYRQKFRFISLSPDIKTADPSFPSGQTKQDKHFGSVEIYRNRLEAEIPIQRQTANPATLVLEATFQGCADVGICYMPIQKLISVELPEAGDTGSP